MPNLRSGQRRWTSTYFRGQTDRPNGCVGGPLSRPGVCGAVAKYAIKRKAPIHRRRHRAEPPPVPLRITKGITAKMLSACRTSPIFDSLRGRIRRSPAVHVVWSCLFYFDSIPLNLLPLDWVATAVRQYHWLQFALLSNHSAPKV